MSGVTMKRDDLAVVIAEAAELAECSYEEKITLTGTAYISSHIAVGHYQFDNSVTCGCPAVVAGYFIPASEDQEGQGEGRWAKHASHQVEDFTSCFDGHEAWHIIKREGGLWGNLHYVELVD